MGKNLNANTTQSKEPTSSVSASGTPAERGMGIHLAETAWRVAVPFFIFSLGGIWADRQLDTEPLFSVIGVFVALASVAAVVYKYVNTYFPGTFKRGDRDG